MTRLTAILLLIACNAIAGCAAERGASLRPGGVSVPASLPSVSLTQSAAIRNPQSAILTIRLGSIADVGFSECGNLPASGAVLLSADRPGVVECSPDLVTWSRYADYAFGTMVIPIRTPVQFFRLRTP